MLTIENNNSFKDEKKSLIIFSIFHIKKSLFEEFFHYIVYSKKRNDIYDISQ